MADSQIMDVIQAMMSVSEFDDKRSNKDKKLARNSLGIESSISESSLEDSSPNKSFISNSSSILNDS